MLYELLPGVTVYRLSRDVLSVGAPPAARVEMELRTPGLIGALTRLREPATCEDLLRAWPSASRMAVQDLVSTLVNAGLARAFAPLPVNRCRQTAHQPDSDARTSGVAENCIDVFGLDTVGAQTVLALAHFDNVGIGLFDGRADGTTHWPLPGISACPCGPRRVGQVAELVRGSGVPAWPAHPHRAQSALAVVSGIGTISQSLVIPRHQLGLPYLNVRATTRHVLIGPFTVPGVTPCADCDWAGRVFPACSFNQPVFTTGPVNITLAAAQLCASLIARRVRDFSRLPSDTSPIEQGELFNGVHCIDMSGSIASTYTVGHSGACWCTDDFSLPA